VSQNIPNSVIGAVSSVIAAYYFSHSTLNSLFMEAGAPGDAPEGNCEKKCNAWLKRCNDDPNVDGLVVLGEIIQKYMDLDPQPWSTDKNIEEGQWRIATALAKNNLEYQINGSITLLGSSPTSKTLSEHLRSGDFASIESEFSRALDNIGSDPHAAGTAASSIIEALCKVYIEANRLEMPAKQVATQLWRVVHQHLALNDDRLLKEDQQKMIRGLSSIVDSVSAFRTHIGSAHGRGMSPPPISNAEARLAVNAAHTLVVFVMELWHTPANKQKRQALF